MDKTYMIFSSDRLSCTALKALLDARTDLLMVDVRNEEEYNFCKIEGSINLPLRTLMTHFDQIDQQKPIVMICHHGVRSLQALKMLQAEGFKNITNLEGGIDAWSRAIDPSVDTY